MSTWFRTYGFADILDQLLVGAYPVDQEDIRMLSWMGVERVLNLVEDEEYAPGEREAVAAALGEAEIEEHRLRTVDYGGLSPGYLEAAVQEVNDWLNEGLRTYVHCRAGWQRSPAVAAGVVALRQGLEIEAALAYVQSRKPSADPLPHQREDLERWWKGRRTEGTDRQEAPRAAAPDSPDADNEER
jgi:protein-tyrosine phosphatase